MGHWRRSAVGDRDWRADATTTNSGVTIFAADGSATSGRACQATDSRLSNARTALITSMADGVAANNTLYYSTTQSKLVYKSSDGTVNPLY